MGTSEDVAKTGEKRTIAQGVEVVEFYRNYKPRRSYTPYVCDLLKCVPKPYLAGLDRVVLTDASGESRRERRKKTHSRGKKVFVADSYGYYQPECNGNRPYIQLNVDRIYPIWRPEPTPYQRLLAPLIRPALARAQFAHVLFHEIGHHIHAEKRPEQREKENVADRYGWQLFKRLLLMRWYLMAPAMLGLLLLPSCWRPIGRSCIRSMPSR